MDAVGEQLLKFLPANDQKPKRLEIIELDTNNPQIVPVSVPENITHPQPLQDRELDSSIRARRNR